MKQILLIAGEVSGDHHGAALVKELKKLDPEYSFFGIGGDGLKSEGMDILFHIEEMAFLGIGEIIRHLPFIKRVKESLIKKAKNEKPVCAVLIDYPGFNMRMAKALKQLQIPVLYYISPQLWAWGKGRLKNVQKYIDKMLVLFPFEKKFYKDHDIEVEYVGHPLVDKHVPFLKESIRRIDPQNVSIGLLPGSRKQEVNQLLPKMISSVRQLFNQNKINRAEIVKVTHLPNSLYSNMLTDVDTFITIVEKPLNETLPEYDAIIAASGTATLETGYFGVPMLIVYHVNPLTYWLGKLLVKVPFIGLVNIVAEKQVAFELIQKDFTVEAAISHLNKIIEPKENLRIREELKIVRDKLGQPGASSRAAQFVNTFIDDSESLVQE